MLHRHLEVCVVLKILAQVVAAANVDRARRMQCSKHTINTLGPVAALFLHSYNDKKAG